MPFRLYTISLGIWSRKT